MPHTPTPLVRWPHPAYLHRVALAFLLAAFVGAAVLAQSSVRADLQVRDHPVIGPHLVDAEGRTLYVTSADSPYVSTCVDACAANWPPAGFAGLVPSSNGVDATRVGGLIRPDGSAQAMFDGLALYTFAADEGEGSILGIGRGGVWAAIAPDGRRIESAEAVVAEETVALTAEELFARGQEAYAIYCAACHQADGSGNVGPNIRSNARVGDDAFMVRQIRDGISEMPGFGNVLSNEDLAAVATFVRASFGNDFPPLAPDQFVR